MKKSISRRQFLAVVGAAAAAGALSACGSSSSSSSTAASTAGSAAAEGAAGATIKAPVLSELFPMQGPLWRIDPDNLGGQFVAAYKAVDTGLRAVDSRWFLGGMLFNYYMVSRTYSLRILINTTAESRFYCNVIPNGDSTVKFEFSGNGDVNASTVGSQVPQIAEFFDLLESTEFDITSVTGSELYPSRLLFTSKANANDFFYVDLQ